MPADRLRVVGADELGPGPWGAAASPTQVGDVRALSVHRAARVLDGPIAEQVTEAARLLVDGTGCSATIRSKAPPSTRRTGPAWPTGGCGARW